MRQNCKNKVISLIKQIRQSEHNQKCQDVMLILDDTTSPILSAIVSEFLSLGVKNVTKASLVKKPYPNFVGIYFISKESLPCVFQDFKKGPIYHSINILINQTITPDLMQMVADHKNILQRLAYFGELFIDTKFVTNNVAIVTKEEETLALTLRGQMPVAPSNMAERVLQALVNGFEDITKLKIYYTVSPQIQELVQCLTVKFKMQFDHMSTQAKQPKKALNLIVMDRRMDLVSPLVSNFYYLNMISDIFKVDFEHRQITVKDENKQNKKIMLNLQDPIFADYKNLHISKVNTKIEPDFQTFRSQNKAAQYQQSPTLKKVSSLDLKKIIRDIPQYKRKVKSYEQQIQIALAISAYSTGYSLPEIGDVEQCIVSGLDRNGEEIKDKKLIMDRAFEVCQKISDPQKIVKIMLLMLMSLECSQSKKMKIISKIKQFPQYSGLADFIETRLFKIMQKPLRLRLSQQKERIFLSMHQSLIQSIMIELIQKGSSKYVKLNVVGQEQTKSISKFEAIGKVEQKQWVVVMLGGISLNQIVHLERLQSRYKGTKVNFLTTEVLTSWGYLNTMNSLNNSDKNADKARSNCDQ